MKIYVGFSKGSGLLANLIRLFTGGIVNHAFLIWQGADGRWTTLGANESGVSYLTLPEFYKGGRTIENLMSPPIGDLRSGLLKWDRAIGSKYNFSGLFGMAGVEIARAWFRDRDAPNLLDDSRRLFCSEFCTDVIRAAGYTCLPGEDADTIDPENLLVALRAEGWADEIRALPGR